MQRGHVHYQPVVGGEVARQVVDLFDPALQKAQQLRLVDLGPIFALFPRCSIQPEQTKVVDDKDRRGPEQKAYVRDFFLQRAVLFGVPGVAAAPVAVQEENAFFRDGRQQTLEDDAAVAQQELDFIPLVPGLCFCVVLFAELYTVTIFSKYGSKANVVPPVSVPVSTNQGYFVKSS